MKGLVREWSESVEIGDTQRRVSRSDEKRQAHTLALRGVRNRKMGRIKHAGDIWVPTFRPDRRPVLGKQRETASCQPVPVFRGRFVQRSARSEKFFWNGLRWGQSLTV